MPQKPRGGGHQPALDRPQEAPVLQVVHVRDRLVRLWIKRPISGTRARPEGTSGICLFSCTDERPSMEISCWTFQRVTSRMRFDVDLTTSAPGGSKIWLAAFWVNPRGQRGPTSAPVSTYIGDGLAGAA